MTRPKPNQPVPVAVEIVSVFDGNWARLFVVALEKDAFISWIIMLCMGGIHSQYSSFPHPAYWVVLLGIVVLGMCVISVSSAHRIVRVKR